MAYGMSASELARVGQNVNKQGTGVDEQSIQSAMSRELDEDRKEQVGRFKKRKATAAKEDAAKKAQLKSNMVKAVVDSAVMAGKHAAKSAPAKDGGPTPRSERVAARAEKAGARGNVARQARLEGKSKQLKTKEDLRAQAQQTKLTQKTAKRKAAADKKAAAAKARAESPEMQRKRDLILLEQRYGNIGKRKAYSGKGKLYQQNVASQRQTFGLGGTQKRRTPVRNPSVAGATKPKPETSADVLGELLGRLRKNPEQDQEI